MHTKRLEIKYPSFRGLPYEVQSNILKEANDAVNTHLRRSFFYWFGKYLPLMILSAVVACILVYIFELNSHWFAGLLGTFIGTSAIITHSRERKNILRLKISELVQKEKIKTSI
ncbi:MAG: hypothetical protein JXB00_20395 [Bacteroidales bacterium]|nr:hypothetical protein [Bacteroidales bacterium]